MDLAGHLIKAHGLGFLGRTGAWLFKELNFSLSPGEVVGLLGRNGVGKTTLLRTILGRLSPTAGKLIRQSIPGYVPQTSQLAFDYKVRDVLAMGRTRYRCFLRGRNTHDKEVVDIAMEKLRITHLSNRSFMALSGGERQLVLIARAIACESKTLLLDEPMAALDLDNQSRLLNVLSQLAEIDSLGIIFSTHNPDHLFSASHKALILHQDASSQFGDVDDILTGENLERVYGLPIEIYVSPYTNRNARFAIPHY